VAIAAVVFCAVSQCVLLYLLSDVRDVLRGDLKEQRICVKFCVKLGKTALEKVEMLKPTFGDNAMAKTKTFQ
jgi:hypothetical protein